MSRETLPLRHGPGFDILSQPGITDNETIIQMPLEECLEGPAFRLSNNKRTPLWLARPVIAVTLGVREAVRLTQKPLPSVWTKTRATCRSVAGIWINW